MRIRLVVDVIPHPESNDNYKIAQEAGGTLGRFAGPADVLVVAVPSGKGDEAAARIEAVLGVAG